MTFSGRIGRTVNDSVPAWDRQTQPSSPNVLVVVLDDVGYGQLGSYGSSIATPRMDGLAGEGTRFSNFHVTALCSPTRASLLTGRNHHAVGVGFLADFDTGYPGYRGTVTPHAATLAEMLGTAGYGCYAVGKWHLTPPDAMTPAGPFDQWPTGRGFDRYYGFLWGEDDQWAPDLWYDQHHVEPPARDGYHLSEDLVDRSQEFIADHLASHPERPFYLHLAFGACHAPHQAPTDYLERYRGTFDHGWDVERERVLERQIASGLVPEGTTLPPANEDVRPWNDLTADERRLYARMQEAFAGFMEHTDTQIGRLLDFLATAGLDDDTIVILMSDNGASGEGGPDGSVNEYRYFWGLPDSFDENLARIDDIGGPFAHNHYPSGWAQAGNTPSKMYKKYAFGGGVRAPLIMRWTGTVPGPATRSQFHHVIDIVPTVLDLVGVDAPTVYRGVEQMPIHGRSMSYVFDQPDATSQRTVQYFETAGQRGIYRNGFKLVANHVNGDDYDDDVWELYDITRDFSESHDLSADHPELVEQLVDLWWAEAAEYSVLPLDDRMATRIEAVDPEAKRPRYRYFPGVRVPNGSAAPNFRLCEFTITAKIRRYTSGMQGVIVAFGRRAAGFTFFLKDDTLVFEANIAGHRVVVDTSAIAEGAEELAVRVVGVNQPPACELLVDGAVVARSELPSLLPAGLGTLTLQVGHNSPSPVTEAYSPPFRFGDGLQQVIVDLGQAAPGAAQTSIAAALAHE